MATVSPAPFAIALLVGLGLFAWLTYILVQDSRRPVRFRTDAVARPHVSHTRVAIVVIVFTAWSLWATARPVSGWR
jgi:hypothetical protein